MVSADNPVVPTLLLADDSLTIQRVVALIFADEDMTVVAVGDGDQAIASIESAPPDIILADIGMPGRTGYDVARHVKGSPRLAHIPVVLLTGAFEPVDEAAASASGCDALLGKPFDPPTVIAKVAELLATSRTTSHVEGRPAVSAVPPSAVSEAPPAVGGAPPLADAFAALLAAEQGQGPRPSMVASPAAADVPLTAEFVDAVAGRVFARLASSVSDARVADIVSTIAERLVREEIDRIKSSIT
jgi:CheY-like chemotaxis protein